MYTRSYKVEYHPEELRYFTGLVSRSTYCAQQGKYCRSRETVNNYPYDVKDGEWVKTLHLTIRYWEHFDEFVGDLAELKSIYSEMGFDIQENSQENKSIPEIPHFHAVKVLEYL